MTFLPDLFRRRPRRPPQPRPPSPPPPPPPDGRAHEPIRLTNHDIAPQGCEPVGYSYWPNVNNHRGADHLYVFVGRVGDRPLLLQIMKGTWSVAAASLLPWAGTAEGWYFSASRPHALYLLDGPRLLRYDVASMTEEIVFTLRPDYGSYLWQAHSSADDLVHSATVRDANYQDLGCLVVQHGEQSFFPKRDGYDECQIDKSGRWLVIKEGNGDNRIVDLRSGSERTVTNAQGAVGHSDCGYGTLIGEDDQGARWKLVEWTLETLSQRVLYEQPGESWGSGMGHVSVQDGIALVSSYERDFVVVPLDGGPVRVVAPAPGDTGNGDLYRRMPKANLDPTGEFGCFTKDVGGGRLDAFLLPIG